MTAVAAAGEPVLQNVLDAMNGIACAVDAENRIVAIGRRQWDRFAIENGIPELCADGIVGRNLFEFVSAPDTRRAYRELVERIISSGEPVSIAAHRSGPGAVRELRLSIAPLRLADKGLGLLFQ